MRGYQERTSWLVEETVLLRVILNEPLADHSRRLQWEWLKDGLAVNRSSDHQRARQLAENRDDSFVVELELSGAAESDSGSYQCLLSSPLGAETVTFDPIIVLGADSTSECNEMRSPSNQINSFLKKDNHIRSVAS